MSAPLTDEEKRRQISVRGVASLEGVDESNSMANALAPSSLAGDGSSGIFAWAT